MRLVRKEPTGGFGRGRRALAATVAGVTVVGLAFGCGESPSLSRPLEIEIDTLAGGGLIVRNGAEGNWRAGEGWRLEEELRIGRRVGDGPDVFGRVMALAVEESGRIWVADGLSADLRVFESNGVPVRTVGRRGGGPGEFGVPMAIARAPDGSMWVNDPRQGRIQVFDTAGEPVASHFFPRSASPTEPVVFDSAGRVLHLARMPGRDSPAQRVVRRDPLDFEPLDTLPPLEPLAEPIRFSDRDARPMGSVFTVRTVPFAHQPELRLQPGRSSLVGWPGGGLYRFGSLRLDGDTALMIERDYEPVPIPPAVLEERMGSFTGPTADALPADRVPEVYPAFDEVDVAPDGHWWVRRTLGPDEVIYEVFSPDGVFLGPVETEFDLSRFELMHLTNSALYGVWRDALDTPYVVRLSIRKAHR